VNAGAKGRARRILILALALPAGLVAARPVALEAGTPAIAFLTSGALAPYQAVARSFHAAWQGGTLDLSLEEQSPDTVADRLRSTPLDVIVAVGLRAATFARDRFPRVPMVFCAVPNYESHDLSGSWITGVGFDVPEREALRALKETVPEATRIGVLTGPGETPFLRAARAAAAANHLTLVEAQVPNRSALAGIARTLATKVDALWMPPDPQVASRESFEFLLELSLRQRKPLLVFSESLVRAGALLSVSPDYDWVGARTAESVRRVLAGERAGDIPVPPLKHSRVVVNEATARAIGRPLPAPVLKDAEVLR
jgi:putative ABC transport system substrate-binding protein